MVFKQITPEPPLDDFVTSIVYYRDFKVEHTKDKFLPDCTTNLVINLLDEPRYIYDNFTLDVKQECKEVWFSGMQTEYLTISSDNESEMMVITFKPGASFSLIQQSLEQFNNKVIPAKDIFGENILSVRSAIISNSDADKKIEIAKSWLVSSLGKLPFEGIVIKQIVEEMQLSSESLNIKDVAVRSGYSQKQFIHLFKKYVGLTPKQFHRIVRFNELLNAIFKKEKVDWAGVANEFGYYDQAHFIKDFQAFSGHNPKKYIDDQGDWQHYIPVR